MITQKELKELFDYNPDTGVLTKIKTKKEVKGAFSGLGYRQVMIKTKRYYIHRLVWVYVKGAWPVNVIDHIDGNRENNRISNLRDVTESDNFKNATLSSRSTSGVTGVSFCKHHSLWRSYVTVNYKRIHLGWFKNKYEAIRERKVAEVKHGFHEGHGKRRVERV